MNIRKAHTADIPVIVDLLKSSLGESLLKKTSTIWHFKHEDNPFGVSYVLVAEENGQFIGVRAFMSWKWQLKDNVWQAYRAVDTATHPEHQGRGIFKKLTLQALEEVGVHKDCFIFNTPNEKSRPGYLKMGWKVIGKVKLALVPALLYRMGYAFSSSSNYQVELSDTNLDALCTSHNERLRVKGGLFTPKSAAYLKWRYTINPMQSYTVFTGKNWYVALYVKKHRYFSELRLAEVIGADDAKARKEIRRVVSKFAAKNACLLMSTTEKELFRFSFYGAFGPILTCKDLTENHLIMQQAQKEGGWQYVMGDLELF